jgi:hypothetical protein
LFWGFCFCCFCFVFVVFVLFLFCFRSLFDHFLFTLYPIILSHRSCICLSRPTWCVADSSNTLTHLFHRSLESRRRVSYSIIFRFFRFSWDDEKWEKMRKNYNTLPSNSGAGRRCAAEMDGMEMNGTGGEWGERWNRKRGAT